MEIQERSNAVVVQDSQNWEAINPAIGRKEEMPALQFKPQLMHFPPS